jgi:hypothetical protein
MKRWLTPVLLAGGILLAASAASADQYPGVTDASILHQPSSEQQRYKVIKNVRMSDILSAPGHLELRDPQNVVAISQLLESAADTGAGFFAGQPPIVLNVFTAVEDGQVEVEAIEVVDGNHRLTAALLAHCRRGGTFFDVLGDIPATSIRILVNGIDVNGREVPHWIPHHCAAGSSFPADWWFEVPASWGARGHTAQIAGAISGLDPHFPPECRSQPMLRVLTRSLERVAGGDPATACAARVSPPVLELVD